MPRTIESIMAAHNEVNRRRAALLPHWALKIELVQPGPKDAIYTDLPRNQLESAAASYAAVLKAEFPDKLEILSDHYDGQLDELIENLEWLGEGAPSLSDLELGQYLSEYVDELYNWADANRVWVEFNDPLLPIESETDSPASAP
jgi:hypothetical protein